jgi:hypothetical protein
LAEQRICEQILVVDYFPANFTETVLIRIETCERGIDLGSQFNVILVAGRLLHHIN